MFEQENNPKPEAKPQEKAGHVSDDLLQQVLREEGVEVIDLDDARNNIKPTTWHVN